MVEGTVGDRTRQVLQVSLQSITKYPALARPARARSTPCRDAEGPDIDSSTFTELLTHLQNLDAVLKGSGMTLKNVVKANIYLSNLPRDFNAVNEVSATCFDDSYFSCSALLVVLADQPPLRFGKR